MTEIINAIINQIQSDVQNIEIVKAAIYASILGSFIYVIRSIPNRVLSILRRITVTTVVVNNNDPAYVWLQKWINTQNFGKRARRLVISTNNYQEHDTNDYQQDSWDGIAKDSLSYKPDSGSYMTFYQGFPIILDFSRERIQERNMFSESIRITTLFRKKLLLKLVEDAALVAQKSEKKSINLFSASHSYWQNIGERAFRNMPSLVYADSVGDELLADAQKFLDEKTWYQEMGIPWRRGYLLYGPPGNGKTSLAFALASELKMDIYILSLAGATMNADAMLGLFNNIPKNSILLIEEIDEAFEKTKAKGKKSVSHTALLNALDGVASREGRITIMTTNYKEKISKALIRPGRADMHVYIGNANLKQVEGMFLRFYGGRLELAQKFAQEIANLQREVSMAELQNHLLSYRGDMLQTISQVKYDFKDKKEMAA